MQKISKGADVFDVSNFFISLANEKMIDDGVVEGITNLKLQKMLYFAQAAHLAIYDKQLFKEEIEAWTYGPVVKSVYRLYKKHNNNSLPLDIKFNHENIDESTRDFLKGVWEMLGKYSATELVEITHKHEPWKKSYEKGQSSIIPKDDLKEYYKEIFVLKSE